MPRLPSPNPHNPPLIFEIGARRIPGDQGSFQEASSQEIHAGQSLRFERASGFFLNPRVFASGLGLRVQGQSAGQGSCTGFYSLYRVLAGVMGYSQGFLRLRLLVEGLRFISG